MKRSTAPTKPSGPPSTDEFAVRELEAFFRAEDPARVAAALWHTRQEQGLTPAEEAQFHQWLSTDPSHQAAFAHINDSLLFLPQLANRQAAGSATATAPDVRDQVAGASSAQHQTGAARPKRIRAWLGTLKMPRATALAFCCVAMISIGIGWMHWLKQPTFVQSFIARRGEQLDVPLPDGTRLALDAETQLDVSLFRDRREVRLTQGQAMFSVAPDASKPFVVLAGTARVTVVGTRFSVRHRTSGASADSVDVEVEVEQGHVQIASAEQKDHPATLDLLAGEAAYVSTRGELSKVKNIDLASIAPWRKGFIHFSNTPLAEAVQEFERYGPSRLIIRDPAVAALQVGGSYLISSPVAFATVLPRILPVRLLNRPDGEIEIVRKN